MPSKLKATGTLYQQIRKGNSLKVVKGINNNNKKNKEKKEQHSIKPQNTEQKTEE